MPPPSRTTILGEYLEARNVEAVRGGGGWQAEEDVPCAFLRVGRGRVEVDQGEAFFPCVAGAVGRGEQRAEVRMRAGEPGCVFDEVVGGGEVRDVWRVVLMVMGTWGA